MIYIYHTGRTIKIQRNNSHLRKNKNQIRTPNLANTQKHEQNRYPNRIRNRKSNSENNNGKKINKPDWNWNGREEKSEEGFYTFSVASESREKGKKKIRV